MSAPHESLNLPQSLGDGLVLRLATLADTEAIAAFNTRLLLHESEPSEILDLWTRDLMSGAHPTTGAADFVVVEDAKSGQIVSSTCLIPQVWRYEDIPFPVGRPELVATDPAYRRRGLVRAIFKAIHDLSAAYGHMVQGITGIGWFYRQFGYEYALSLGGRRDLNISEVDNLKEGETEPYQIRQASAADISTLMRLYEQACAGKLITASMKETHWHYELSGRTPGADYETKFFSIANSAGRTVGYYFTSAFLWGSRMGLRGINIDEGVSLAAVLAPVMRALKAQGEGYARDRGQNLTDLCFALGIGHPVYEILEAKLKPMPIPYAWYIRVPDLPGFIRHIGPVLERRLAVSVMSGYNGDLNLSFFKEGMRLTFEQGRLVEVIPWQTPDSNQDWEGASFPPLVFLQLLFGYRSLAELQYAFADCRADREALLLLNALFPKRPSWLVPLG